MSATNNNTVVHQHETLVKAYEPNELDYRANALRFALDFHDKLRLFNRPKDANGDPIPASSQDVVATAEEFEAFLRGEDWEPQP